MRAPSLPKTDDVNMADVELLLDDQDVPKLEVNDWLSKFITFWYQTIFGHQKKYSCFLQIVRGKIIK